MHGVGALLSSACVFWSYFLLGFVLLGNDMLSSLIFLATAILERGLALVNFECLHCQEFFGQQSH